MFITGTADKTVPAWMSTELHKAATNSKHTRLFRIEGGGHNRLWNFNGGIEYWDKIEDFLNWNENELKLAVDVGSLQSTSQNKC